MHPSQVHGHLVQIDWINHRKLSHLAEFCVRGGHVTQARSIGLSCKKCEMCCVQDMAEAEPHSGSPPQLLSLITLAPFSPILPKPYSFVFNFVVLQCPFKNFPFLNLPEITNISSVA